jgi:hypothetical protein
MSTGKLDNELHAFVWDLMECHDATSKPRVKQSLLTALNEGLADYFDPNEEYEGSRLVPTRNGLVFTLLVSLDVIEDDADFSEPDIVHTINIKTGVYTVS